MKNDENLGKNEKENEEEVEKVQTRREKRLAFYEEHIDDLIIDKKMPRLKNEHLVELAKQCNSNVRAEHAALARYAKTNHLLQVKSDSSENDDDFTEFGAIPHKGEHFTVDISNAALFFDAERNQLKSKAEFVDRLTNSVFKHARKPCCWSYGRIFTESGDVKLHANCLNENCEAVLIVYTENCQKTMKIAVYGYDATITHSKKRYLTGNDEKKKVEALLAIETAMVTRCKLANEYIFSENEYAAHLCSNEALRQRKHRLHAGSYRHDIAAISVQMMKSEPAYKHCIGDIGLDPQYVIFGVPLQKEFLLETVARKRIILSVGATGISIKESQFLSESISSKSAKYKKSFLYIISLQTGNVNVPVFQVKKV